MLKKQLLQKRFTENSQTADKSLKAFHQSHDEEELHELRVGVKKMKAMLLLQQGSFNEDRLPAEFKTIAKIFKKAGKIRKAAMNKKLLKEYHIRDKKLIKEQNDVLKKKGKEFRDKIDANRKKLKKQEEFFAGKFSDIKATKIQRLFTNEIRTLTNLSLLRLGNLQLHECRKKLKNLLYIFNSLPPVLAKKLKLNNFYLKKLEETIGEWHDLIDVVDLLKENGYAIDKIPGKLHKGRMEARKKVHELFSDFHENVLLS
jgi:CHAD domain-containing protein